MLFYYLLENYLRLFSVYMMERLTIEFTNSNILKKIIISSSCSNYKEETLFVGVTSAPSVQFISVQLLSSVRHFVTPWTAPRQASLFITNSQSPPTLMSIESVMPSSISSSVVPFSSCPQSFLASGSFQRSQLFTSGGKSIGVSASASVLPMKT